MTTLRVEETDLEFDLDLRPLGRGGGETPPFKSILGP